MRLIVLALATFVFYSCTTLQTHDGLPVVQFDSNQRTPAAEHDRVDDYFESYLERGNFFVRLNNIRSVAQSLYISMPEQGSAKRKLVKQFIDDVQVQIDALSLIESSKTDTYNYWIPSENLAEYKEKIHRLAQVVQSAKVMDKLGIYLSASKVLETNTSQENFYLALIAKSVAQIELQFADISILTYSIEDREKYYREAQLRYAQDLAINARLNLKKVFNNDKRVAIQRIDKLLLKIQSEESVRGAKNLMKSNDWAFTKNQLNHLDVQAVSDVDGSNDEFERTIATKFGFAMIQYLYENIR